MTTQNYFIIQPTRHWYHTWLWLHFLSLAMTANTVSILSIVSRKMCLSPVIALNEKTGGCEGEVMVKHKVFHVGGCMFFIEWCTYQFLISWGRSFFLKTMQRFELKHHILDLLSLLIVSDKYAGTVSLPNSYFASCFNNVKNKSMLGPLFMVDLVRSDVVYFRNA